MKYALIAAVAATAVCQAFADRVVNEKAQDGQNVVTTVIDDDGYVKSRQMTTAHVQERYVPSDAESAEVREMMQEAIRKMEAQEKERVAVEAVVEQVYGEGKDSSFITRKELTATQKRFIALGGRYVQLLMHVNRLEERLKVLEDERNEKLLSVKAFREKRERDEEKRREKLQRAVKRAQSGQGSKTGREVK